MRKLNTIKKTILALMLLLFVGDSSAFSFKAFFYAKLIALKRFFVLKKIKGAPQKNDSQQQPELSVEAKPIERPIITVWIHGTSKNSLLGVLKKDGPKGLLKMEKVEDKVKSKRVATALMQHDTQKFPKKSFYLFRWSGKLSYKEREAQAYKLYHELKNEIELYRNTYGVEPYVRIITHSHGGNVALNLAKAYQESDKLSIDQLILLACPVQETTAYLIKSPLFKKVYALYSTNDFVQVVAPQGIGFSSRKFPANPNMIQAKVKVHGKSPGHFDFVTPEFMRHLAGIITHLEQRKHGNIIRVNSHG